MPEGEGGGRSRGGEAGIRPERFARLVTLATVLIAAGREGRRIPVAEVCEQLQISEQELREDISVLNVVNFGGGAYVIYAEVLPTGEIEVDPEPYSDTFDRPARLLPIEANALVAAIDLIGARLAQGALASAREKIVAALGHDPVEEGLHVTSPTAEDEITRAGRDRRARVAPAADRILGRRTRTSSRTASSSPTRSSTARRPGTSPPSTPARATTCATSGWTGSRAPSCSTRRFERREDLDPVADVGGWPRTGEVEGSRTAHVWISPEQARWASEERTVLAELPDGAVIVEWALQGHRRTSCARCSRRPATPPCSSRPTPARPCWPPPRACSPRA